ncbi:hypothetical protein, partial [Nocardia gamkensis]|uniref:hypothetical protein n=1 Tax=Nocardia gamkensis TaxID=352869 RepID=UPI001FE01C71
MVGDLTIEGGFDDHLGQLRQQPTLTGQLQAVAPGLSHQLTHQFGIHRWCCRILTLRHRSSIGHISRHYIRYQVPLLDRELHRCIYSP